MIHASWTVVSLSDDATLVVGPDIVASRDSDVDGANLNGGLDAVSVLADLLVGGDVCHSLGRVIRTL